MDWRAIAGFRNVLVHDYLAVDLDAVWAIVDERLTQLKDAVSGLLKALD